MRSSHLGMVRGALVSKEDSYQSRRIFALFMDMREKKILASVIEIQKEKKV